MENNLFSFILNVCILIIDNPIKCMHINHMSDTYTWDENKRQSTLAERGVDFADMTSFAWDTALTATDTRNEYGETRYISLGFINIRLHVCVWCYREDTTRIISLRKANKKEIKSYEES